MIDQRIANIYLFSNGMVMVFDQDGRQIPEYQGPRERVLDLLKRVASDDAQWYEGTWMPRTVTQIPRP
jgi:hypothetical protein